LDCELREPLRVLVIDIIQRSRDDSLGDMLNELSSQAMGPGAGGPGIGIIIGDHRKTRGMATATV
jgi:hypothetical protein